MLSLDLRLIYFLKINNDLYNFSMSFKRTVAADVLTLVITLIYLSRNVAIAFSVEAAGDFKKYIMFHSPLQLNLAKPKTN